MIQILTLIRFAFPFLLLTAFFCLYRKEYGFMKRFMWKMAMFQSARNLYAYLVVLMLIFINWCCHVTTPNLSVVVSTLLTLVLLNKKIAESHFHLLHESLFPERAYDEMFYDDQKNKSHLSAVEDIDNKVEKMPFEIIDSGFKTQKSESQDNKPSIVSSDDKSSKKERKKPTLEIVE